MFNHKIYKLICAKPFFSYAERSRSLGEVLGMRLILISLLLSFNAFASNPVIEKAKADLKKMNAVYESTPTYSMDIQYTVYDSHVNGNLVETKSGQFIKYKSASYTKLLDLITVVNAKNTIVVNNEEKAIVIADTKKVELSPLQTNMDTILSLCNNVTYTDIGVTLRHYVMEFDDDEFSEFSKIDIYINLSNYSLNKIVLFYNQMLPLNQNDYYAEEKKPRLEITYKSFKVITSPNSFITELFNESNYLTTFGNTYTGSLKYSKYKVINQLNAFRFKKK